MEGLHAFFLQGMPSIKIKKEKKKIKNPIATKKLPGYEETTIWHLEGDRLERLYKLVYGAENIKKLMEFIYYFKIQEEDSSNWENIKDMRKLIEGNGFHIKAGCSQLEFTSKGWMGAKALLHWWFKF